MPQDRFIHPRLGHSEKVTLLTDFEYRVWTQYLLSADDFGVMRASAVTLQSDNDALHAKKASVVQRALEHLIKVALVLTFQHQGRIYVFQKDWQAYQKIEWPRSTIQPAPTGDDLAHCDEATTALFGKHPGGLPRKKPTHVPIDSGVESQTYPEPSPSLACARPRETANAKAHGSGICLSEGERERKPDARSKRPMFTGQRLTVFEWMFDDLRRMLGVHTDDFGLDEWFYTADAKAMREQVVMADWWPWLKAETQAEAQRRGLPIAVVMPAQTAGKLTQRMAAMVANSRSTP